MKILKKIVVVSLVLAFSFSPLTANKASAQWVDVVQAAKETVGDTLAWMVINKVIERMTASTVNWINSGFKGSPAYVTDPESYFKDLGDKVAGQYIFSNPNLNFLCGPIKAKIRLALTQNYMQEEQWQCTLTDVGRNMEDFMNDFSNGGWDNFFELTQRQQNNPIGAYLQAENQLQLQLSTRQGFAQSELAQGNGFMSFKKCRTDTEVQAGDCEAAYNQCVKEWAGNEAVIESQCAANLQACDAKERSVGVGNCSPEDEETVTPGSVIQNQLDKALGAGSDKLQVADEINEIVSALLNQLVNQVVGGIGRGLRGASGSGSSPNTPSITSQLSNSPMGSITGYFCDGSENCTDRVDAADLKVPSSPGAAGPDDADCAGVDPDELVRMATAKIEADPLLTSDDLEEVIKGLDCDPPGIN